MYESVTSRQSREELERKRADERARQQAEAQRLIEEKRRREEEEQRRAEEERAQAMKEAALLQKQVGKCRRNHVCTSGRPRGRFLFLSCIFDGQSLFSLFFSDTERGGTSQRES